ncbi:unnamed protein product [Lasius platythorax]|uniref:GDNF/GAS1 domain-containing protein n=1 Tax=Lasius platythorax TaxID=488582 RepID=A0AAV2N0J8_9HYME
MKLIRYAVTPIRARWPLSRDKIRTCNLSHPAETLLRRFNNNFAVTVACSTVTVTKCQAALRTLQAFTYFRPTCLCREPHVDPDCNSFQNFLFDHPCDYVEWKDKDPYPVDALPTCNHALSVCLRGKPCSQILKDFKANCKIQESQCKMENR